jgi:hypothetical protein
MHKLNVPWIELAVIFGRASSMGSVQRLSYTTIDAQTKVFDSTAISHFARLGDVSGESENSEVRFGTREVKISKETIKEIAG